MRTKQVVSIKSCILPLVITRGKSFGDVINPVLQRWNFFSPVPFFEATFYLYSGCWHWGCSPMLEPHLHSLHDIIGHHQCRCRRTNCQVCTAITCFFNLTARVSANSKHIVRNFKTSSWTSDCFVCPAAPWCYSYLLFTVRGLHLLLNIGQTM